MYNETVFTLYATVGYVPIPWATVSFEGSLIRCGQIQYSRETDLWNPVDREPDFWRRVRNMAFDFKDWNRTSVEGFYKHYGAFGLPADREQSMNVFWCELERWDEVTTALDWFRVLTLLVEWIKQQKVGPIRDLFGSASHMFTNPDGSPYLDSPLILFGQEPHWVIRFVPWPVFRRAGEGMQCVGWRLPSTDAELFHAAWQAAIDAAQAFMRSILSLPTPRDNKPLSVPVFSFYARGALQAAFLQWFFREVVPMGVRTCEAEGCENAVLPPRKTYCSERCRQREKKRRQRHELGPTRRSSSKVRGRSNV